MWIHAWKAANGKYRWISVGDCGLKRLHLESYIDEIISPDVIVPACGQGTIVVQIRKEDYPLFDAWVKPSIALQEVQIEREFLALCKAGCHYPVGVWRR